MSDPTPPAQPVTWDQIQQGISNGVITEAQGQQIWADHIAKNAVEQAGKNAEASAKAAQLKAEFARYTEALPALKDKDSPEYKRFRAEFERLEDLGFPVEKGKGGEQTELAALLAAFGPQSALRRKTTADDPEPEETVEVNGGGSAPEGKRNGDGEGFDKSMSADEKRFYAGLIQQGVLKDAAEANELLKKYGKTGIRKRHGAKL